MTCPEWCCTLAKARPIPYQNTMPEAAPDEIDDFIARWSSSGGRERANYALFLTELCDVLDLPHPEPAQADAYC